VKRQDCNVANTEISLDKLKVLKNVRSFLLESIKYLHKRLQICLNIPMSQISSLNANDKRLTT